MNRIVREHYPVSKLPEDLQQELRGVQDVRVVIETHEEETCEDGLPPSTIERRPFSSFRHLARDNFKSMEDVVEHIRALRDEWDERDQFHERLRNGS